MAGEVALMQEKKNTERILVGKAEGKNSLGGQNPKKIDNIKWIMEIQDGMLWMNCYGLGLELVEGSCEHGNKRLCSIIFLEVVD
jgi:hypothetical protein